jgi:DNA-binding protein HU-beta
MHLPQPPRPTKEPLEYSWICSDIAYKEIKKNGEFVLPGFGKLVKQKRKARTGFNPKTQQKIKIPAKTVVKFRVAKAAKDAVLGVKK